MTTMMELLSHNASSPDPLHQEVIHKRPLAYQKMENLIKEMQDPEHGVPVRSQKLFLTSIPAAFAGYDIIEWLMERMTIEDSVEAIHLANLLCQHGYFFPVGDNRNLSVKDDSSLYRFQTPYYWPSQVPCLDSVDYAIWLVKRTLRNKQKHGLDDYEIEALNNLRKTLVQKWDFISMQADEQVRISKDRKKVDKLVTDSQERAFWRVLRPPPGSTSCVETPPMHMVDFHANEGVKQIRRTNLIEDLRAEVDLLRTSCMRSRTKVSQALESLACHCDSYNEHDPFLVSRQPSNPWTTDDTCFWMLNAPLVDVPTERRVKKWGISMEDLVFDATGLREFTTYLKKEYCHENIRFWLAVRDLRYGPMSQLRNKAQQIYNEFLSPGAPCEINIDMRTMDAVQKEMNYLSPSRFTFDPAANHVYAMLLKKDCYPRFIRSEIYKNLLANAIQPNQKKRFFNFSAPIKKKSSTTNPVIFPVGSQSATAGIGEVLKATDEVILLTTGNKPGDFSASHNDPERLSAMSDIPYRGDMVPEVKDKVHSIPIRKALSQSSFDDVCPWESMEKLPEKEGKLSSSVVSKYESPPPKSLQTSAITKAASIVSKLTCSTPTLASSSAQTLLAASTQTMTTVTSLPTSHAQRVSAQVVSPASVPISIASISIPGMSSSTSGTSESPPTVTKVQVSEPSVVVTSTQAPATQYSSPSEPVGVQSTEVVQSTQQGKSTERSHPTQSQSKSSIVSTALPKQGSVVSNASSIHSEKADLELEMEVGGVDSSGSQLSLQNTHLPPLVSKSSIPDNPPDQNQNVEQDSMAKVVLIGKDELEPSGVGEGKKKPGPPESLVEVCPWDHENGTQPETTTFTKTYSTLGYL